MNEEEIRAGLDEHNLQLFAYIEDTIPVKFTMWDRDYYECHVHKDNGMLVEAEIKCKEPICQAKIAHELLHAKISVDLGDIGIMFSIENRNAFFDAMMSDESASIINNACEHVISFPEYIEMGYDEKEFFEEAPDIEARLEELDRLYNHGLKVDGHYDSKKVFSYLSLLLSFLFYPNEKTFAREVKKLRKINVQLFVIFNKLRLDCKDLDIIPENREFIQDAYLQFATSINKWFEVAFKGAVIVKTEDGTV